MKVEQRIYVLLPRYIVTAPNSILKMECGRLMSQASHAVSKLKIRNKMDPDLETTQINLQVDNENILAEWEIKAAHKKLNYEVFRDSNKEFYGSTDKYLTAIAVMCSRKQGKKHFYSLVGWRCELEKQ